MPAGMPERLLAKKVTGDGREKVTLLAHSEATENAAIALFKEDSRFLNNWLRFFKVDQEQKNRFLLNLRVACLLHDIGKANEDFQKAVSGQGFLQQGIRHEHLSALILHLSEIRDWLGQNKNLDIDIISACVLTHHIKSEESGFYEWGKLKREGLVTVFLNHHEIKTILNRISAIAFLENSPLLPTESFNSTKNNTIWDELISKGKKQANQFRRILRSDSKQKSLFLSIKAGLIASDSIASGLVREEKDIIPWINEKLHGAEISPEDIYKNIIQPRIKSIEEVSKQTFKIHNFQSLVASKGGRVLLLAPCGAGKTFAAWEWAKEQSRINQISRVIFLYPTRGTATEGFKDYVASAPETDAALMHGSAKYELQQMFNNPLEKDSQKKNFQVSESEERLFALAYWSKKYFSSTVDQFLNFLQNNYKGLCLLPPLADSLLIIDEIHSFDKKMFESLLSFLQNFDIPVLCMTATLQNERRSALLEKTDLKVYPDEKDNVFLKDLVDSESRPRYNKKFIQSKEEGVTIAMKFLDSGKKVLWVVNTIAKAQELSLLLTGYNPICYHSMYKLSDRQEKHRNTVQLFKEQTIGKPVLAVTTQVCEMSLDLDADVMITELAPVSSLIQRFGRVNRKTDNKPVDFRGEIFVYKPDKNLPYVVFDIDASERFINSLPDADISQKDMAYNMLKFSPPQPEPTEFSQFIQGGYYATSEEYRDIDDFTEQCVLDSDLPEIEKLLQNKKLIDEFILPVPKKMALKDDLPHFLPKYLSIANATNYKSDLGFIRI
jgi:CRISPR-associated endonuclease/helicase Cas3